MNSSKDTTHGTTPRPAQQGGEASAPRQQQQSPPDAGSQRQQSGQQGGPPDAVPGRQYQGSGVMNKSGRFGSSQAPDDLSRQDDPGSDGNGKEA